jgi:hypothetical protein
VQAIFHGPVLALVVVEVLRAGVGPVGRLVIPWMISLLCQVPSRSPTSRGQPGGPWRAPGNRVSSTGVVRGPAAFDPAVAAVVNGAALVAVQSVSGPARTAAAATAG